MLFAADLTPYEGINKYDESDNDQSESESESVLPSASGGVDKGNNGNDGNDGGEEDYKNETGQEEGKVSRRKVSQFGSVQ